MSLRSRPKCSAPPKPPKRPPANGVIHISRRVSIVGGAFLVAVAVAVAVWQGGEWLSRRNFEYHNRDNARRFEAINRRLDAGALRDSLILLEIERVQRAMLFSLDDPRRRRALGIR